MNQPAETRGCAGKSGTQDARLDRIHAYLDGALSWDELLDLQDHLAGCPECAQEYSLECIIRSVVSRSCHETAPEGLKGRIRVRIDEIRIQQSH